MEAEARVLSSPDGIAEAIVALADELDSTVIVVGSRGIRGLKSMLAGSVSDYLVHHARRPALVIPSPALAQARGRPDIEMAASAA